MSPGLCVLAGTLLGALLAFAAPARAGDPRVDYMLHCQGCHLPDGTGKPGAVPSLAGSVARFLTVEGGREFLVRVPGSALSSLDDASLAAVLNWMVREFGPAEVARTARPFDAGEVGRLRARPLTDVAPARAALVSRFGAPDLVTGSMP